MATQLWCCDFGCGYTEESEYRVKEHEIFCNLNPDNEPDIEELIEEDEENDEGNSEPGEIGWNGGDFYK
jgi:hypothetical protein